MLSTNRWTWRVLALVAVVVGATAFNESRLASQEKGKDKKAPDAKLDRDLSVFMRAKLDASNQVLEGLVTEDAGLIRKGAEALAEMSKAEKWKVSNDVMYRQFSGEFQRAVAKLAEAAEKEKFDQAALKWIDTTMSCIDCHKFVRGARLAQK